MNKILTLLVAATFIGALVPSTQAVESVTREYVGALGYFVEPMPSHGIPGVPSGRGIAFIFCYAPGVCNFDDDMVNEGDEIPFAIGGADLIANGLYTNAIVSINDDTYGSEAAMAPCFYNPDGDLSCDGDDYPGESACGPQSLLGSPFASNFVSVFVYAVLIQDDLTVCGATGGSLTADMF